MITLYAFSPVFNTLSDLENWIADSTGVREWIAGLSIRDWYDETGLEEYLRNSIDIDDLGDGVIRICDGYYQIFSHEFSWEEFDRLMEG